MKKRLLALVLCIGMAFGNASAVYGNEETVMPAETEETLEGIDENAQVDSLMEGDVAVAEENNVVEESSENGFERGQESMEALPSNSSKSSVTYEKKETSIPALNENNTSDKTNVEEADPVKAENEGIVFDNSLDVEAEAEEAEAEEELEKAVLPTVLYHTHVQTYGWEKEWKSNGAMSGTQGQSKRLEGIEIKVSGADDLGIRYMTHIQTYGWEKTWKENGDMSGTQGQAKRLEAIRIELTGTDAANYDIWYCVHAQHFGWLDWAKNGESAGTAGYAYRLEGIKIKILPKGSMAPIKEGSTTTAFYSKIDGPAVNTNISGVTYNTHVQSYGWQDYVYNGDMAGTSGQSKRLEGIHIYLNAPKYPGGIEYRTHVQTYGWQGWKKDGQMSGTFGESKRLEAIEIKLTGDMANHYDVYYCVHAQTYGWLDWAKNGEMAGTSGLSKRLEGIKIILKEKGESAPGNTERASITKDSIIPTQPATGHVHNWVTTARYPALNVSDSLRIVNKKSVCTSCGAEIIADQTSPQGDNGSVFRIKLTYADEKKNQTVITDKSSTGGYIVSGNYVFYRGSHNQPIPTRLSVFDLSSKTQKDISDHVSGFRLIGNYIYFTRFEATSVGYGISYGDMCVMRCNLNGTGLQEICRVGSNNAEGLQTWELSMFSCRHTNSYMIMKDPGWTKYFKVDYATGSISKSDESAWNNVGPENSFAG